MMQAIPKGDILCTACAKKNMVGNFQLDLRYELGVIDVRILRKKKPQQGAFCDASVMKRGHSF